MKIKSIEERMHAFSVPKLVEGIEGYEWMQRQNERNYYGDRPDLEPILNSKIKNLKAELRSRLVFDKD